MSAQVRRIKMLNLFVKLFLIILRNRNKNTKLNVVDQGAQNMKMFEECQAKLQLEHVWSCLLIKRSPPGVYHNRASLSRSLQA